MLQRKRAEAQIYLEALTLHLEAQNLILNAWGTNCYALSPPLNNQFSMIRKTLQYLLLLLKFQDSLKTNLNPKQMLVLLVQGGL